MNAAALALGLWLGLTPPPADVSLDDLARFPDHRDAIAWADAHVAWIECQLQVDLAHDAFWAEWLGEARFGRQPWRELMLARCDGHDVAWRLRRLRDLRDLIGPGAYREGRMPCVVNPASLWRFRELP